MKKQIFIISILVIVFAIFIFQKRKKNIKNAILSDEKELEKETYIETNDNAISDNSQDNSSNICLSDEGKFSFNWWKTNDVITIANVNLRDNPNTGNSNIIATLNAGEKLIQKNEADYWAYIETADGLTGYVCKKYIMPLAIKADEFEHHLDDNWRSNYNFNTQTIL